MVIELNMVQIGLILAGCVGSWQVGWYVHVWSKWPYLAIKAIRKVRVRTTPTHLIIEKAPEPYDFCMGCDQKMSDPWMNAEERMRHVHAEYQHVAEEEQTDVEAFDAMTEKQKEIVYLLIGEALEMGKDPENADEIKQYADNIRYLNLGEN